MRKSVKICYKLPQLFSTKITVLYFQFCTHDRERSNIDGTTVKKKAKSIITIEVTLNCNILPTDRYSIRNTLSQIQDTIPVTDHICGHIMKLV